MPDAPATTPAAILVHLSDLHFSCDNPGLEERNSLIRDRLCVDLNRLLEQEVGAHADAVLVTGDIAYGGQEAEYLRATAWFEHVVDPITNGSTRILCVPGNHDVDWSRIGPTHEAHRAFLKGCADEDIDSLLDRYLAEDGQAILHPLAAYNEFAASVDCQIEDRYCWDAPLRIGGGYQLAFRGVTSVVNSYNDDGPETLAVHSNQLLETPEPGRIPILLAHHDTHFWRRYHRLDGDVTKRMSIAMYGHTHTPRLRRVEDCIEITGGAVHPEEGKDWMPAYNVLQLHVGEQSEGNASLQVRVWRRRFSTDHDAFVPDVGSGTFEERTVSVPAAAASDTPAATEFHVEHEEGRVALTSTDGSPHPVREIQRALYHLGAGDRITILAGIGMDVDELARLPAHRLIPSAATAIIDQGKLDEFYAALATRQSGSTPGDISA